MDHPQASSEVEPPHPSPGPDRTAALVDRIASVRRTVRYAIAMGASWLLVRALFRVRIEGLERLPAGPALLCFNHQSWLDPFVLMAALPWRPRLYFFGPREADMSRGTRNRLMIWTGTAIPFRPDKDDLIGVTRRVAAILAAGNVVAIAGEGRIHAGERELLPLDEGAAFFAIRSGVPLVPVAVNGTSWLVFGRRLRVQVGEPIATTGRPTREAVAELRRVGWTALHDLVADFPDPVPPATGSLWYRLTELFNEWPDGTRPAPSSSAAPATGSAAGPAPQSPVGSAPPAPAGLTPPDVEPEILEPHRTEEDHGRDRTRS